MLRPSSDAGGVPWPGHRCGNEGIDVSRILVVDDEETIRVLLQAHLKQSGHRVLTASSAQGALSAVREHGPPDVARARREPARRSRL